MTPAQQHAVLESPYQDTEAPTAQHPSAGHAAEGYDWDYPNDERDEPTWQERNDAEWAEECAMRGEHS